MPLYGLYEGDTSRRSQDHEDTLKVLAAYFWDNPGLKSLELDNCPVLTNCVLRLGRLTIEIR